MLTVLEAARLRSRYQHRQVLVRAPLLVCRQHPSSYVLGGEIDKALVFSTSSKMEPPSWGFHSWCHLTLVLSQRPHSHIPSHWGLGLPLWPSSKEFTCDAGEVGSVPGWKGFPGKGNGNPLLYSCLGNSMDRGAWQATVHGVPSVGHNLVTKPATMGILGRHKHSVHSNALKAITIYLKILKNSMVPRLLFFANTWWFIQSQASFCGSGDHTPRRDGRERPEGLRVPGMVHGKVVVTLVYEIHGGGEGVGRQEWDMIPWSGSHSYLVRAEPRKGLCPGLRQSLQRQTAPPPTGSRAGIRNLELRASLLSCIMTQRGLYRLSQSCFVNCRRVCIHSPYIWKRQTKSSLLIYITEILNCTY